jgi:hypothetical protein
MENFILKFGIKFNMLCSKREVIKKLHLSKIIVSVFFDNIIYILGHFKILNRFIAGVV